MKTTGFTVLLHTANIWAAASAEAVGAAVWEEIEKFKNKIK